MRPGLLRCVSWLEVFTARQRHAQQSGILTCGQTRHSYWEVPVSQFVFDEVLNLDPAFAAAEVLILTAIVNLAPRPEILGEAFYETASLPELFPTVCGHSVSGGRVRMASSSVSRSSSSSVFSAVRARIAWIAASPGSTTSSDSTLGTVDVSTDSAAAAVGHGAEAHEDQCPPIAQRAYSTTSGVCCHVGSDAHCSARSR